MTARLSNMFTSKKDEYVGNKNAWLVGWDAGLEKKKLTNLLAASLSILQRMDEPWEEGRGEVLDK